MSVNGPSNAINLYFQGVINNALPKKLHVAADALRHKIVENLSKPGTGNRYRRRGVRYAKQLANGKRVRAEAAADFHIASAPGNPPAADTGRLRGSATSVRTGLLQWRVGVKAPAAETLETKMNRPYLKPSVESWRVTAGKRFAEAGA